MKAVDVEEAVREVRQGRVEAYRQVIALTESKVRLVLLSILPDRAAVDDGAQEVYVLAYQKLAEYVAGTHFDSWVKEIARNWALRERRDWLRRQAATRRYRVDLEQELEKSLVEASRRTGAEALDAVRDCVGQLEGSARSLLEEHYWQGTPCEAIAKARGRSTEWVWVVLHRARALVVQCLKLKGVLHGCG